MQMLVELAHHLAWLEATSVWGKTFDHRLPIERLRLPKAHRG